MGEIIEVSVERPVAGGAMLARHEGAIVLVTGAIPGERIRARVTRAARKVTLAETVEVLEASADRRTPPCTPACGGMLYAHIAYERQRQLKAEVVADAFRRVGHLTLESAPDVAASPETGYRLRARLHVRQRRAGFYLEGTHTLCDAASTGQLREDSHAAIESVIGAINESVSSVDSIIVAENVNASQRVVHLEPRGGDAPVTHAIAIDSLNGVTGLTTSVGARPTTLAGVATVTDTAADLFHGKAPIPSTAIWTRSATSFFQGNRYLTGALVDHVLTSAAADRVVDLYAGVGLFAVALAASGSSVVAIEGDRAAAADLKSNARPWHDRLLVEHRPVEAAVSRSPSQRPDVVVVDPPRTGVSPEALTGIINWRVPRMVYVSCDPPTLARDSVRLREAGYALRAITAFDLFPNTPHVETVVVFERSQA